MTPPCLPGISLNKPVPHPDPIGADRQAGSRQAENLAADELPRYTLHRQDTTRNQAGLCLKRCPRITIDYCMVDGIQLKNTAEPVSFR